MSIVKKEGPKCFENCKLTIFLIWVGFKDVKCPVVGRTECISPGIFLHYCVCHKPHYTESKGT